MSTSGSGPGGVLKSRPVLPLSKNKQYVQTRRKREKYHGRLHFPDTALGKLPNELLDQIGSYLGRRDLASLARVHINSELRKVAERLLYTSIDIKTRVGYIDKDYYEAGDEVRREVRSNIIELLHRTLCRRPDLAALVKVCKIFVDAPSSKSSIVKSLVFGIMENLRVLEIHAYASNQDPFCTGDVEDLRALGLRHLQKLAYYGPGFRNIVVYLPALTELHIDEGHMYSPLRPIAEPSGVPSNLQRLFLVRPTTILNAATQDYNEYVEFLKPCSRLKNVTVRVFGDWYVQFLPQAQGAVGFGGVKGSFTECVAALEPCRQTLEHLQLGPFPNRELSFLGHCSPVHTLRGFSALKSLEIPYEGLLGQRKDSDMLTAPPIEDILPPTLEVLAVTFPKLGIWWWLYPLATDKRKLPALRTIFLQCSMNYNDSYEQFFFIHRPNRVERELEFNRGIQCHIQTRNWRPEWNDYDLQAMDLVKWQASLGPSYE